MDGQRTAAIIGAVSVPKRKRIFNATTNAGKTFRPKTKSTFAKSGIGSKIYRRINATICGGATTSSASKVPGDKRSQFASRLADSCRPESNSYRLNGSSFVHAVIGSAVIPKDASP